MYTLHFDGLYREHWGSAHHYKMQSGLMCYGWLIHQDRHIIGRGHGALMHPVLASSNGAEYLALIEGLEAMTDMGIEGEPIWVVGDNKSVIDQMAGMVGVSSPRISQLYQRAYRLSSRFRQLRWSWEPRKRNQDADLLTRRALKQVLANEQVTLDIRSSGRGFHPIMAVSMMQR